MPFYSEGEMMDILSRLEEKPEDFDTSYQFFSLEKIPIKIFSAFDEREQMIYEEKKLNYVSSMTRRRFLHKKKEIDMSWDLRIREKKDGYFDSRGNFIMSGCTDKEELSDLCWLVRKKGCMQGPYNSKEMKNMHEQQELNGSYIKRDTDKIFVEYEKIKQISNVFTQLADEKALNTLYQDAVMQRNGKEKICDMPFYDAAPVMTFSEKKKEKGKTVKERCAGYKNTIKILKRRQISIEPFNIFSCIKGFKKEEAIEKLKALTGICRPDNEELIDTFFRRDWHTGV